MTESIEFQIVQALLTAIELKDQHTKGHSERVAEYSKMIASRYGLSEKEQENIYMMALLHDVGKIGIPDEILNKFGRLMDMEYDIIKRHTVMGAAILENIKDYPELATGARFHHERFDGSGYPDGLAGDDIPIEARIIAVAEAYDAMTSQYHYREPFSQDQVRAEIERCSGSQFDPMFAKIMIEMIDEDSEFVLREK